MKRLIGVRKCAPPPFTPLLTLISAQVPHLIDKVEDDHQSDTVNSMATFAGSDACHQPMENVEDANKTKKKNKCCVIL